MSISCFVHRALSDKLRAGNGVLEAPRSPNRNATWYGGSHHG